MTAILHNAPHEFYWDASRDTTMGRYLFRREQAFIRQFLDAMPDPRRILDIGCGSGQVTLPLHQAGFNIVGIDIEPAALAAFKRRSNSAPIVMGDAICHPFADNSFTCIVAVQSFLYLNHHQFLAECKRVLCSDGMLIFDFVNRYSYKWPLKRLTGRVLSLPSINFNCREVLSTIADHGFDIEVVSGYNWVPFTRESNSALVHVAAILEQALRLDHYYTISPSVFVAARKRSS